MFFLQITPQPEVVESQKSFIDSAWDQLSKDINIANTPLPFSINDIVIKFLLPFLVTLGIYKIIRSTFETNIEKIGAPLKTTDLIKKWVKIILRIIVLGITVFLISNLFEGRVEEYIGQFLKILNEPILTSGSTKISITTVILCIPIFYIASWTGKQTKILFNKKFLDKLGIEDAKKFSIVSIARYFVMTIVLILGLNMIGINLSSIAVIFGILGIGIGFGLQNVVSNFFSGLIIIFSSPIKEGDRVLVDGYEGTVEQISSLSTVINTTTDETIIVPNSSLVEKTVYNYSYKSKSVLIKNSVQVSYDTDLDKAIEILTAIGKANPYRPKKEEIFVRVKNLADSGIDMLLIHKISDVSDKYAASSLNNYAIIQEFRKNKINIPFPHMNVIIDKD
ncbi:MAG: mechanosensitive ion channel [Spirochaetales bacterium]|nr:mechanosensitive ion channel [Spirochaetales bacterium]